MTTRATEKIVEGLSQFMEGFQKLQEIVESDFSEQTAAEVEDEDEGVNSEIDAAIIAEVRAAIESVLDAEDYTTEEFAAALSTLTEAIEELDPDVFEREGEEEEAFEDDDEDDDDDDFYDDDDDDLGFDDDEL